MEGANEHEQEDNTLEGGAQGIWPRSIVFWAAAFWIALIIIRPWEKLFPELGQYHVARVYAIMMLGLVFFSGRIRFCPSLQTCGILAFLTALAASSLFAIDPDRAWAAWYVYLTLVAFYFVLLSAVRTPYDLLFITAVYTVVMAMYLGKAQVEYFFFHAVHRMQGVNRLMGIDGTYNGPNELAESIVLSLPVTASLWRIRHIFTESWPEIWQRAFTWGLRFYFVLAMTSVVMTNSRSGMLGFVLFLILTFFSGKTQRGKLKTVFVTAAVLAAIWVGMPATSKDRLRTLWDAEAGPHGAQTSAMGRVEGLKAGFVIFTRYPLLGVGPRNSASYRAEHVDGDPHETHNLLGQLLAECGLIGMGAFLWLIAAVFRSHRKTKSLLGHNSDSNSVVLSTLSLTWVQTVCLLLYFGLFQHNLYRFNWLWAAAFGLLTWRFSQDLVSRQFCASHDEEE